MLTLSIPAWAVPTIITVCCFVYAIFIHDDGPGYFSGIGNLMLLAPASFISMLAWIVYAIFK